MYQNYIFDFYGTLVDIRTNESKPYLWKKMSELYSSLGASYNASELKTEFRKLETEAESVQIAKNVPIVQVWNGENEQKQDITEDAETTEEMWSEQTVEVDLTEVFAGLYHQKGVPAMQDKPG